MKILGFILACCLVQQIHAQDSQGLRASTYYFDLGKSEVNQKKLFEVSVKNHSEESLRIKDVYGNCSCVQVTHFPEKLEAGEEDTLRGYMLSGTKGELLKYLIVISDLEPTYQKIGLRLLAE